MAKDLVVLRRPAILLRGGRRHGWCYYEDDWLAMLAAEKAAGRPVTYRPTQEVVVHPTAQNDATVTVWAATG